MSLFDYPRINIQGTLTLNPGTANNCDLAGFAYLPGTDQTLALVDSKNVQPITFGMSDADFIAWVQQPQLFDVKTNPPSQQKFIPAEWNYYGDMSTNGTGTVVGVQMGPGTVLTSADASPLIGASLTTVGNVTDVNSEGSPPSTQFFIQQLTLQGPGGVVLQGKPSKGACQWINFYRNVNQAQDAGAGGYMYHVIYKGPGTTINLPGFDAPNCIGAIFRYYVFNVQVGKPQNSDVAALYAQQQTNPATAQFVATIAPLFKDEQITTGPVGRLLVANTPTIPTPPGSQNNGIAGKVALAPTVIAQRGDRLIGDFLGTFPDCFQNGQNPKYDFGPVSLYVNNVAIGPINYSDETAGNELGWIFEFALPPQAQAALRDPNATLFAISSDTQIGTVLGETDYYFPSNQQAIYAEQTNDTVDSFLNQGTYEPATVPAIYHRGVPLPPDQCPQITLWAYRTVPLQSPGNAVALDTNFKPTQPIRVDASQPGDYLFTFTVAGQPAPPQSYSDFMNPPFVTNSPSISLRILPNEDYSQYYVDPLSPQPIGNDSLTFDVVFTHVLRVCYLLFPAMNKHIDLSSESAVNAAAQAILTRTDPANWMNMGYMPRTRDMSASRRTLLQAYCRKVLLQ